MAEIVAALTVWGWSGPAYPAVPAPQRHGVAEASAGPVLALTHDARMARYAMLMGRRGHTSVRTLAKYARVFAEALSGTRRSVTQPGAAGDFCRGQFASFLG